MQLFSYLAYGLPPTGFDPEKSFVRSNIVPPLALAVIRAIISIYCFTTLIVIYSWLSHNTSITRLQDIKISPYYIVTGDNGIGQSLSFFTYLTYWGLGFYFLVASIYTFQYSLRRTPWLYRLPKSLQLLHSFFYTTITCFPFLVSIVFWCTMYSGPWPKQRFVQWVNISVHGLDSVFAIVEIILSATAPFPWTHLPMLLLILSVYLGLAYLTRATGGFYVYEWMNPAHGAANIVVHIICYTVVIIAIFFLVMGAIMLRSHLTRSVDKNQGDDGETKQVEGSASSVASKENRGVDVTPV